MYVQSTASLPVQISRLVVNSGRRQFWKTVSPSDLSGIETPPRMEITPKGDVYAYGVQRVQSTLYVVGGLK